MQRHTRIGFLLVYDDDTFSNAAFEAAPQLATYHEAILQAVQEEAANATACLVHPGSLLRRFWRFSQNALQSIPRPYAETAAPQERSFQLGSLELCFPAALVAEVGREMASDQTQSPLTIVRQVLAVTIAVTEPRGASERHGESKRLKAAVGIPQLRDPQAKCKISSRCSEPLYTVRWPYAGCKAPQCRPRVGTCPTTRPSPGPPSSKLRHRA